MTSVADARADSIEQPQIVRQANRLWRRAGVRRTDRQLLLTELESELNGAHHDGHGPTAVLGEDSDDMLRSWAQERGMCGRALRLGLVVPAAFIGILAGLAVVLLTLVAGFRGWSPTFEPGQFVLPFYATGGALAFLCALLCVWGVLRRFGDPRAATTVRWLAALLPVGAVLTIGAGVALAWWRNFNTSPKVFVAVTGVVIVGLVLIVGLARYLAVRETDREPDSIQ